MTSQGSHRSHNRGTDRPDRSIMVALLGWGLAVWLTVAISMALFGHVLLSPGTPVVTGRFFLAVVPLMALVTYPIYWVFEIPHNRRPAAAAVMSIPGMGLDVILIAAADVTLPVMSHGAVRLFGAVLLFGYAVVLLTGLVPRGTR